MASDWSRLRELPLWIESAHLEGLELEVGPGFTRHTTVLVLSGRGYEGQGEDVVYETEDQLAFQAMELPDLRGEYTLESFSDHLGLQDLFGGSKPQQASSLDYRRWTFESAALDLALQQNELSLAKAIGRASAPVKFVASLNLGSPAELERIHERLAVFPELKFKLDASTAWTDQVCADLAQLDCVRTVDLKGYYSGTPVDLGADPELYERIAQSFPNAWIEDPLVDETTMPVLEDHFDRLSFDAPIHSVEDVEALPVAVRCLNIKPSRCGKLERLFELYSYAEERGMSLYAGGQFELGPGRSQILRLASLYHADASNDCAPSDYHGSKVDPAWPRSPLTMSETLGFSTP